MKYQKIVRPAHGFRNKVYILYSSNINNRTIMISAISAFKVATQIFPLPSVKY